MKKDDIIKTVDQNDVGIIRLFFTDIQGRLKGLNVTVSELERALDEGIPFDGSSIEGFVRIEESDLIAMPDPATFRLFPFEVGGVKSGMFMCDITMPDGSPFHSDPRHVLRTSLDRAANMGFDHFYVGPELEFFYFPSSTQAVPLETGGYFDTLPVDSSSDAREAALATLRQMGISMEASHHEVAPSQHELDYRYGDALQMADQVMISKLVIKQVARQHGFFASFMPKPIAGINGSGMHVHQSLFKKETNAFFSGSDPYNLSDVARQYIAGLLTHAKEITAITNPTVNSYKRLVPGYEAPAYITWGRKNRSALVRVPAFKEGKSKSCRAEYRAPDPAANPYLAFASMLSAGLAGINGQYKLGEPVEKDIFRMSESERTTDRIDSLPGDLYGATRVAERSALLRETLGNDLFEKYLANKYEEWERYRMQVTDYELRTYLPVL